MAPMRVLREADIRAAIDMATCIEACEEAFAAYARDAAELPGVIHLDVPESRGEVHVKAGHLHGFPFFAVKVASGFAGASNGMVMVFDAGDGSPAAILLDGGYLTDLRTGAAGGIAAKHLAPSRADAVAVIGTGRQARFQLEGLAAVRPGFTSVRVWGRDVDRARRCVDAMAETYPDTEVARAPSVHAAVDGADVIVTCTASTEPLVKAEHVRRGAHITAVGSDGVGKQELDPEILRAAYLLVVDSRGQCERFGELQHAPDQTGRAIELGELCAGSGAGRTSDDQLTVCDLTGVGVQDVAAACAVMERAHELGDVLDLDR